MRYRNPHLSNIRPHKIFRRKRKHDCDKCKYLGQFGLFDIYECTPYPNTHFQFIFRYGDKGYEYAIPYITKEGIDRARQVVPNMKRIPYWEEREYLWLICHAAFPSIADRFLKTKD